MNVSKSANNANSSSNIPNPSEIPDIESGIQTIVKSWSFRCLGIGKAELNQQIQQLKTIAVSLNNIKNKTETTESNSNLKNTFNIRKIHQT